MLTGSARHRLRDRAHAADGVPPHARTAIHFAERMMQQHIGGPRRIGTRQIADDGVKAQHRLDRIGFEPAIERFTGRFAKQVERDLEAVGLPQPLAEPRKLAKFAQSAGEIAEQQIGRRLEHQTAQHRRGAADFGLIVGVTLCVTHTELGDFARRAALAGEQVPAVGQRQKILRAAFDDAQAVAVQIEIANDLGLQEAHRIGRGRVAETGMKFFGHACAADHIATLEHTHPQASHAEIGRAGQPVVAGSDDDGVKLGHEGQADRSNANFKRPAGRRRRRAPVPRARGAHPHASAAPGRRPKQTPPPRAARR